ncbi:helix-turn-helix domain-containing protein [Spongisporangium articulatum]|uniref:Helix-turn-helix domain-containing protein n=1 Tax=Spongisporangium articulatum TaxID=3362603 RepID=A0ABW8AQH0_9ACTN
MSVEAISLALHHSRATGTVKLVLIGIANHEGDGGSWPSIATLARYANASERTVQRAIRQLEELGEVVVAIQAGGLADLDHRYRPNRYEVTLRCPPDCDGTTRHRIRGDAGVTPRGDAGVAAGVTLVSPKPSLNHPSESSMASRQGSPAPRPSAIQQDDRELLAEIAAAHGLEDDLGDIAACLRSCYGARFPGRWLAARHDAGELDGLLHAQGIASTCWRHERRA